MTHDDHHEHGMVDVSDGVLLWTVIVNLGLSVFEFAAGVISGTAALGHVEGQPQRKSRLPA